MADEQTVDAQYVVSTDQSLNLRSAGTGAAGIVASIRPDVIVHVTGPANAAGYAPAYVFGFLGTDGRTLFADSFARGESTVDAVLFDGPRFEPQGAPDAFGRQPGKVSGFVFLAYLTEAYKAYLEGKK